MVAAASFSTLKVSNHSSRPRRNAYAASVVSRCGPKPGAAKQAQLRLLPCTTHLILQRVLCLEDYTQDLTKRAHRKPV